MRMHASALTYQMQMMAPHRIKAMLGQGSGCSFMPVVALPITAIPAEARWDGSCEWHIHRSYSCSIFIIVRMHCMLVM